MKDKILIVCPTDSSPFVQLDASILSLRYSVEILSFDRLRNPKILSVLLSIGGKLMKEKIACVLMWFSVPHLAPLIVVLARIFRAKILAITGGFDVAFNPNISWGEMGFWWKRSLQRFTLYRVDRILPFSEFSRRDTVKYAPEKITSTVYPGIDTRKFTPSGNKENLVVTVCNGISRFTIIQKGLDIFSQCARALPEYQFLIIGQFNSDDAVAQSFFQTAPENLKFIPRFVSNEELVSLYRRAKVYVQASAHEGFGIACAEAMACECVPVGTMNTSLPEVIGNTGYLVAYGDRSATMTAIRSAMATSTMGSHARKRVIENFSIEKRSLLLLETMKEILAQ